ncbi:hypothetical protein HDU67_006644 [Dinochytrium kinnereticum]|nr:hypothetical protein HDU67_006644 [Dinochytrium kinnereticum]
MDAHLQHCITFLSDVRDFVKERADLEKEFARKLESLARRHAHRRERRSGAPPPPTATSCGGGGVGRGLKEGEGEEGEGEKGESGEGGDGEVGVGGVEVLDGLSTTTERAWGAILLSTENRARAHLTLSNTLSQSISERLKTLSTKREEGRKKKLVTERDKFYAEKDKAKKIYDDACDSVEGLKAKHDRTSDAKSKERFKKAWQDETLDLNNAKNLYVLAIDMANAIKKKYYMNDLPQLLKDMQELAESTIQGLKSIWTSYSDEETHFLETCTKHTNSLTTTITQIDPKIDADPRGPQFWFSLRQEQSGSDGVMEAPPLPLSSQPPDFVFVPSMMWREKAGMLRDEDSKVFLINRLRRLRAAVGKLDQEVAVRLRGVEGMRVLMEAYVKNPAQGDAFEVKENILEVNRELTLLMNTRTKLKTNIDCIVANVGVGSALT